MTSLEKPAPVLLRLVGKKTTAKKDSYQEEWTMELRTSDVRPDYSGLVKTQVKLAKRLVNGEEVGYDGLTDPSTEFLNETVDRFGGLHAIQGTLPTPHLILFPEEPQKTGGEWERSRQEILPVTGPDGRVTGFELMEVTYRGRVEEYVDDVIDYAVVSFSGSARKGSESDPVRQEYTSTGTVHFALHDGHILTAEVVREMKTFLEVYVLTVKVKEDMRHAAHGTEKSVGGMRI